MKKAKFNSLILLTFSLAISVIIIFAARGLLEIISKELMLLLIPISVSMAGFGLVIFQIRRATKELKKDFIDFSILMTISSLLSMVYLAYPEKYLLSFINLGHIGSFFFLWGISLFLLILLDERFEIV